MRLKTAIWVSAYLRRLSVEGVFAAVVRRGAEDAGAVFVKLNRLDGSAELYGPAPQTAFEEAYPTDRRWQLVSGPEPRPEADVDARLEKEKRFDSDIWILEVEDRAGRHFLEPVVG